MQHQKMGAERKGEEMKIEQFKEAKKLYSELCSLEYNLDHLKTEEGFSFMCMVTPRRNDKDKPGELEIAIEEVLNDAKQEIRMLINIKIKSIKSQIEKI